MPLTNMTDPSDYRARLLADAQALVRELDRDEWEGCAVREIVASLQATLDEDRIEKLLDDDALSD